MSERFPLEATSRTIIGKKVSRLRSQGHIPAVIYGPKGEPVHIAVEWPKLRLVLMQASGTHVVDVSVDGTTIPTLIRSVQRHHVQKDVVLHVDFYAVDLTETVVTSVPLVLIKEEETARLIAGQIIPEQTQIDIEALPTNIPSEIIVDVSIIKEIGQSIYVTDLTPIEGVKFLIDEDAPLVRSDYRSDSIAEEDGEGETDVSMEPERITRRKEDEFDD